MFYRNYVLLLLLPFWLFTGQVLALPIHSHCDIKPYSLSSGQTDANFPRDYRPDGNASALNRFRMTPLLNAVPPPSTVKDCNYEISDITEITLNFTFEGVMAFDKVEFDTGGPMFESSSGPLQFVSGVDKVFQFIPHQTTAGGLGPIEWKFLLPTINTFYISLINDNDGFKVTGGTVTLRGSHYYVPEPGSWLLLSLGLLGLLFGGNRSRQKA